MLDIRNIAVGEIQPAPYNPRVDLKPGHPAYERLRKGIAQFDLVEPLVWNKRSGNLVGGHQRFKILQERGDTTVPVSVVDLDDHQEKALNLALNKHSGEWDLASLADLVQELDTGDFDMEIAGFDEKELDELATWAPPNAGLVDENAVPEPPADPITRLGDLWILGRHRLLCGDSTKPDDVARLMDGQKAALMSTDPPYLINYQGGDHPESWASKGSTKRNKHWDDYHDPDQSSDFFAAFISAALPHLHEHAAIYQWHASIRQALVEEAWKRNGLHIHQQIIWVKTRPVLTRCHFMWQHEPAFYGWRDGKSPKHKPPGNERTVWNVSQAGESDGIHPTQKPVELFRRPLLYHTNPGGLAYEPFSGSFTQGIAAESEGRRICAMELEPAFVDVAVKRWEAFTGKKAELSK